MVGIAYPSSLV